MSDEERLAPRVRALSLDNERRREELSLPFDRVVRAVKGLISNVLEILNSAAEGTRKNEPEVRVLVRIREQLASICDSLGAGVSERDIDKLEEAYRFVKLTVRQLIESRPEALSGSLPPVPSLQGDGSKQNGAPPLRANQLARVTWNVRLLLPDERQYVERIEAREFLWERLAEGLQAEEPNTDIRTWGVIDCGRVVGYVRWSLTESGSEIQRLWVEEDHRGRGIGRAMCDSVQRHSTKGPVTVISRERNQAAIEFLKKVGFTAKGIARNAFIDPVEDGYVWQR